MTSNDDTQLTALFTRLCRAWTGGDADAYGGCFTADSDYVSYDGAHAVGRRPKVESHDQLFRGVLAGSALVGEVESIRYLRPDVARLGLNAHPPRRRPTHPFLETDLRDFRAFNGRP